MMNSTMTRFASLRATIISASSYLNWAGLLIALWTVFYPRPYEYAMLTSTIFPFFCIVVSRLKNNLYRIEEEEHHILPRISPAIFVTSAGLCLRAALDYRIYVFTNVFVPSALLALCLSAIMIFVNSDRKPNKVYHFISVFITIVSMSCYSFGSIVTINCMDDTSVTESLDVKIISKRAAKIRSQFYYLELMPWGFRKDTNEMAVPFKLFHTHQANDTLRITIMKGRLEIPWYVLS